MTKTFSLAVAAAAALLAAGCGQTPPPAVDPVQLERVLAALQQQERGAARFQERLAGADRLSTTLSKIDPSRLNPEAAAALLQ